MKVKLIILKTNPAFGPTCFSKPSVNDTQKMNANRPICRLEMIRQSFRDIVQTPSLSFRFAVQFNHYEIPLSINIAE